MHPLLPRANFRLAILAAGAGFFLAALHPLRAQTDAPGRGGTELRAEISRTLGGDAPVTVLAPGENPQFLTPSWEQLMNGSLAEKFVELKGMIDTLQNRKNGWTRVDFRTRDGVIRIEIRRSTLKPARPLEDYQSALIRIRGKLFADTDVASGRVKVGQVRIYDAEILVAEPAPADVFAVPGQTVQELSLPNLDYNPFRRVKISGQVVFVRGDTHFAMDAEGNGFRFLTGKSVGLQIGDRVEAAGFPELSGTAPVLRGAVARQTGSGQLPPARLIEAQDLTQARLDAIRVRVQATLASVRQTQTNVVMEMQAGSWRFLARLNAADEEVRSLKLGSRLELTGIYCAQAGNRALGEDVAAVDLLMSSFADIKVLVRPSWWTLKKLLLLVGVLAAVLALAVLWITQLHRQMRLRTAALRAEMQERQRAEQQRELERERTRIAQDLHDELGSSVTEISMLAARAKSANGADEIRSRHLEAMGEKTRAMVGTLDEIVWTMNPRHDSLSSLVSYFSLYAERFLGLANIAWRLESPELLPDEPVNSHQRHQLFLAFKEALNNVVRHSGATEVRLLFRFESGELQLAVVDNGRGLATDDRTQAMDGVANMRTRIEKLGGRFELASEPGGGATVWFCVPLIQKP